MQQIKPGIYYEDGYLGVTLGALAFPHGLILIDAPLRPEDARSWRAALFNLRSGPARVLVSLDAHLDRTLGARAMECTIITHANTAQVFRNRPIVFKGQSQESGADWETFDDVIGTRWASPDITFSHQMALYWGGPAVILEHHPGPAPGAVWAHIPEERIVFVGDAVTPNQPPFLSQADLPTWIETLEAFVTSAYRDYLVVSGRGGIVTLNEVRAQLRYLKTIDKALERLAKKNAPAEMTDTLVKALLSEISFPAKYSEQYTQRLRAGLYHYYTRHYRQENLPDQVELEEDENRL
jgi:glyoxylase-like metal-dependent hydrolase (beta-lactamase superfamily II)